MSKRYMSSGCLRAKPQDVVKEKGVITGVKVCSEGEAKGYGFHLEKEFIEAVVEFGNKLNSGLKARFGHPNMCSEALGTFIGRFKNFSLGTTIREDGTEATCCFAELHLSESAKETPNGDLHSYILSLAESEADMFGTSIVFSMGDIYRRNETGEKVYPFNNDGSRNQEYREIGGVEYIECKKLHACDCVDEPAANDGLFSAFSSDTVAGQLTEFLDLHPQVFQLLEGNQEVMEALAQYGGKIDTFMESYREYRNSLLSESDNNTEEAAMSKEKENATPEVAEEQTAAAETKEQMSEAAAVANTTDVDEAKETGQLEERERQKSIRELGAKFGFGKAAQQFADDGKSVAQFQEHILEKSPDDWKASLSIQNPSQQITAEDADLAEGDETVARIKARRASKFGNK